MVLIGVKEEWEDWARDLFEGGGEMEVEKVAEVRKMVLESLCSGRR